MLVCNVSLRPPGRTIAADLAEPVTALDATATGTIVFATLVDDPASVAELVDAYLGSIMLEAASTSDTADATVGGYVGPPLATMDGAATDVTLSNGNLTATHSTNNGNSGVRSLATKTSGKYYFEATVTMDASNSSVGLILSSGTYFSMVTFGNDCVVAGKGTGNILANNASSGKTLGGFNPGDKIGVAIDLNGRLAWFRKNGGNWNGDGAANPATGAVGVAFPATLAFTPVVGFGIESAGFDTATFNFGQSAFANAAPSGFGNWTA